jgi:nicotinamide-nucleotide amidase
MLVEVVAVGTELLLGQTINGNAAWLGARLVEDGHTVSAHQAVPDVHEMIVDAIRLGLSRADAVIVTGGLGPTKDDLTREAIADVAGVGIAFDDDYARRLDERWRSRFGSELPVSNFKQAEHPEGAERLRNPKGTAPGLWLDTPDGPIIALPGVPPEMQALFTDEVAPRLRRVAGWAGSRHVVVLRTYGLPESTVDERLGDIFEVSGNPSMALLASDGEIKIRLIGEAGTETEAMALVGPLEAEVRARLGSVVFGRDDETVERLIHVGLAARGWTVAAAESMTGGHILERLTGPPGASEVVRGGAVVYATQTKVDVLGVAPDLIDGHGVVSEPVATAMAEGVIRRFGADVGLSITGVAGPGPSGDVEAGTVCIGVAGPGGTRSRTLRLPGDRERVRRYAATAALHQLLGALREWPA